MGKKRLVFTGLSFVVIGLVAMVGFRTFSSIESSASQAESAFRLSLREGYVYRYDFQWHSQQRTRLPGAGANGYLEGDMDLAGELRLEVHERRGDRYLLSASFASLARHDLIVSGAQALPDPTPLLNSQAVFELRNDGELRTIRFSADAPELLQDLMQGALTQLRFRLGDGEPSWQLVEPGPHGFSEVRYSRKGDGPDMQRERLRYTTLTALPGHDPTGQKVVLNGHTDFHFERGALAELSDVETVRVLDDAGRLALDVSGRFAVQLREVAPFDASLPNLASAQVRNVGEQRLSDNAERRLLENRIDGLTLEQMLSHLTALGRDMPDLRGFLWRATGLLKLHPEYCERLMPVFEDPVTPPGTRSLVLDLLTSAGHGAAQAVLRELLVSDAAQGDVDYYPLYVQRLSLLDEPEVETVEFLAERVKLEKRGSHRDAEGASLLALGASTGHLAATEPKQAERFNELLRSELSNAHTPEALEMRLRALGNTGFERNVGLIQSYASAPDGQTRRAAARALRKNTTRPDVRRTLLDLMRDEDEVQSTALHSLKDAPLEEKELEEISAMVEKGELSWHQDAAVVNLLARTQPPAHVAVPALQTILARREADKNLAHRVRVLLARYGVG